MINYLRNKYEGIIDECLGHYAFKKSEVLSNELINIQNNVNFEKNGYLRKFKTQGKLREEAISYIKNLAKYNESGKEKYWK